MYNNRENRPFVNPKAIELRTTRMSARKRMVLSKQKAAEETELNSDVSIEQPETFTDINTDSSSSKTPDKETTSLQHQRQQTSALREQQQMNTPRQRQRSTTPQQQQKQKQNYSSQRRRSSSKQKSEILEQRIRKAGGRVPFSISDENELYEFLLNQTKHLRGNKIYEQLAEQNPRHTAHSWRDHALENYVDKPNFIKEWNRKWFPSNDEKEDEGGAGGEITTNVTNRGVKVARIDREKEVNSNKEQINDEESSDYMLDLESDDAATEALILGQPIAQEKEHIEEEVEEEQPTIEEEVDGQQSEKNYSDGSEVNVGIDDEYLPVENELNKSSEDYYSVSEDSRIEDGLPISGKTGRTSKQQDTANKIQRQDTLDFDVGHKQKGKRVRQDSEDEDEDEDTVEQQWNTTPSLTPIRQLKETEFSYSEQKFLMNINRLVNETRRPKEICRLALEMSTYHYDTARELLLFGIRSEIYSRIWTDEEDELLLKYQENLNNLNNIIDKHSIELTKERLSYLKTRNEKIIKTKRRKLK